MSKKKPSNPDVARLKSYDEMTTAERLQFRVIGEVMLQSMARAADELSRFTREAIYRHYTK